MKIWTPQKCLSLLHFHPSIHSQHTTAEASAVAAVTAAAARMERLKCIKQPPMAKRGWMGGQAKGERGWNGKFLSSYLAMFNVIFFFLFSPENWIKIYFRLG